METGLAGRRAAVAAATKGLGFACAEALLAEGASVAICGRHADHLADAAGRLAKGAAPAAEVIALLADVSDPDAARRFVSDARAGLGGLDILVTNAGGPKPGTFESTTFEDYPPALALNLLSVVAMCMEAVPGMRAAGFGRVVAITSIAVRAPIPTLILSNTARAGATGFLKTLAREVAASGVTVNSVQPGIHATDRLTGAFGGNLDALAGTVPARTLGRPEDFGAVVAFLCSDQARFITGAAIPVDGGADGGLQ